MSDLILKLEEAQPLIVSIAEEQPLKATVAEEIVIGSGGNLQSKSVSYTPSTSAQSDTVQPDAGYDGLSHVDVSVSAVQAGTEGTPVAAKGAVSNHAIAVTPSVTNTEGYISGGTKAGTPVSVAASELVSGKKEITSNGDNIDVTNYEKVKVAVPGSSPTLQNKTVYPSSSDQSITKDTGYDGLGTVTVKAVTTSNLTAANIVSGVTVEIGDVDDADRVASVTGTASGGNIGGLANMVDKTDAGISYAFMLSAMKNGNTKGGTITWANAFPSTETLMLSTGLTHLNGIILAQTNRGFGSAGSSNQTNEFVIIFGRDYSDGDPAGYSIQAINMNHALSQYNHHYWGTAYNSAPENGTLRLDGGDIYFTGRYNANNSYQIVRAGEQYEWLAW